MDSSSLVFSHQRDTVLALSQMFESVDVFTSEANQESLPANVRVHVVPWTIRSPISNFFSIIRKLFPYLLQNRNTVVFSHMTDVHAAIVSPLTRFLGMHHVLWYAHATTSFYLWWSSFFVSQIVSSTRGSCNLKVNRNKITYINQGVDGKKFPLVSKSVHELNRLFYYGRLDKSKNIHLMTNLVIMLQRKKLPVSLDIFGTAANSDSEEYVENLKSAIKTQPASNYIRFHNRIRRDEIARTVNQLEIFLNLFCGSLDKTLVEVTMLGMPVVTWNREYCDQFGTWSNSPVEVSLEFLEKEIVVLRKMDKLELQIEIFRRSAFARDNHEFQGWINRLSSILKAS
jgi:glycosyltransferase involved in cell wall biosynthesis